MFGSHGSRHDPDRRARGRRGRPGLKSCDWTCSAALRTDAGEDRYVDERDGNDGVGPRRPRIGRPASSRRWMAGKARLKSASRMNRVPRSRRRRWRPSGASSTPIEPPRSTAEKVDQHRAAGADHELREDVTAQIVRAQPEFHAGGLEPALRRRFSIGVRGPDHRDRRPPRMTSPARPAPIRKLAG